LLEEVERDDRLAGGRPGLTEQKGAVGVVGVHACPTKKASVFVGMTDQNGAVWKPLKCDEWLCPDFGSRVSQQIDYFKALERALAFRGESESKLAA
jgi:hypothetical protein